MYFPFLDNQIYKVCNLHEDLEKIYSSFDKKKILVCVPAPVDENLKQFLTKIFAAVEVDMNQEVALLVVKDNELSWAQFNKNFEFEKVFFLGVEPSSIGVHLLLKSYAVKRWKKQLFLLTDTLADIEKNEQKKRLLWNVLKAIFI